MTTSSIIRSIIMRRGRSPMRSRHLLTITTAAAFLIAAYPAVSQKNSPHLPQIVSAKTVYFNNRTGSDPVGRNALAELKKWGKFKIVDVPDHADLILLLSADPYKGGHLIFSGGQTGTVDDGHIKEDNAPSYNTQSPVRYAFLTVIDAKTYDALWSDSHVWGGLLTGFNSVGQRLVKELEKQTKK